MRKLTLVLLAMAVVAISSPQISSFYESDLDDWITYSVDDSGSLYRYKGGGEFDSIGTVPGSGPFSISAFYDPAYDGWIVNAMNNAGEFYLYWEGSFDLKGTLS